MKTEEFPNNKFTLLPKPKSDNKEELEQWIADNIERFLHFTLMCYGSCGYGNKFWRQKLNNLAADLFDGINIKEENLS